MMEPMTGIEPAYLAWEASVLPLNYIGARGLLAIDSLANPGLDDGDRPRCRGYPRDQARGCTRGTLTDTYNCDSHTTTTVIRRGGDHTWSTATAQR